LYSNTACRDGYNSVRWRRCDCLWCFSLNWKLDLHVLVLCVMFCRSLFFLLYFFFWPLRCLLLRYTDSDYPFGIFKLFLHGILYGVVCTYRDNVLCAHVVPHFDNHPLACHVSLCERNRACMGLYCPYSEST
jgi:hypothetical protein